MKELKFETGLSPSPLSKMTDCYDTVEPRVSLNERRVTQGLFLFALICVLGVAQLYLRFSIQEMKSQQRELQVVHSQLLEEAHLIRQENAMLTDPARLRDFATARLRMQETDPRAQTVVTVPSKLVAKYAIDPEKNATRTALAGSDDQIGSGASGIVEKILSAIFDSDRAYAKDKVKS